MNDLTDARVTRVRPLKRDGRTLIRKCQTPTCNRDALVRIKPIGENALVFCEHDAMRILQCERDDLFGRYK